MKSVDRTWGTGLWQRGEIRITLEITLKITLGLTL
jgi:hypothetical protein